MKRIRKDRVLWTRKMREKMSKNYKGKGNPMYGKTSWTKGKRRPGMTGKNHPNYKRGYWISENGYKIIEKTIAPGKTRKRPEHRKIMEEFLGRSLTSNEVVHHKNENRLDNRLENLQVMTRAEHMKHHKISRTPLYKK